MCCRHIATQAVVVHAQCHKTGIFLACVDVGDCCTDCTKHKCIYCNEYCDEYKPENELSKYIRDNHYYDENTLDALNGLFDVIDIMRRPELHQKALEVLRLRDAKENQQ